MVGTGNVAADIATRCRLSPLTLPLVPSDMTGYLDSDFTSLSCDSTQWATLLSLQRQRLWSRWGHFGGEGLTNNSTGFH